MASHERMLRLGSWLFRWRSYLPLLVLALLLAQLIVSSHPGQLRRDPAWDLLVLAVGFFGLAIRVHVAGHVPHGTSGRNTLNQEAAQLNTSGLYSVMRHPLYVGNFFMWMGIALFPHRLWIVVVVAVVYWIYYWPIIVLEDSWLRESFGSEHEEWASRTPAVVPRPDRWCPPALPFSLRTAARREYSGFFALIAVLMLLVLVDDWAATGRIHLHLFWVSLFCVSLVIYLVLRHLKRHTRILHVTGR